MAARHTAERRVELLIIRHNIMALTAHRQLGYHHKAMGRSLQRLSSGYRINSAADDPAGLGISERMRAQITALRRARMNAQDGISMVNVAEGALAEVHDMLNRLVNLATYSANGTLQYGDRARLQAEANQILEEIERISGATRYGDMPLLNGKGGDNGDGSVTLLVGDTDKDHNKIVVAMPDLSAVLRTLAGFDISTQAAADSALERVKTAVGQVSAARGQLGATARRLEHTTQSLDCTIENLTAAESRIRDADMAREMVDYTRASMLAQVAMMMMAHANQQAYRVLELLHSV